MELKDFYFVNDVNIKQETVKNLVFNKENFRNGFITSLEYLQFVLDAINKEDKPSKEMIKLRDYIYDKVGDVVTMFDINIKL